MPRYFNTAGPCVAARNYMLPATARLHGVMQFIEREQYFVLHAPRQSGKTTALLGLAEELRATGNYAAVYATCEAGAVYGDEPEVADRIVAANVLDSARRQLPAEVQPAAELEGNPGDVLRQTLVAWAAACRLPVVLLLDEIDALQDRALVSVLRQLRAGFPSRPKDFPSSLVLCGLRDVRDYKVAAGGSPHLGTASPFNIKVASLTLANFTAADIAALYGQHTAETGQVFTPEAVTLAYDLTRGQPWLVNALAREVTQEMGLLRSEPITPEHLLTAKERLIFSRATHLDSLAAKLNEERVRRVMAPIVAGLPVELGNLPRDDVDYCLDLGLVARDETGQIAVANPIYREVIPRELSSVAQDFMAVPRGPWTLADGRLDVDGLLDAFIQFWRKDAEFMVARHPYNEAAAELVLMAFFQRVLNGGGTMDREYGVGRGRMDLLLRWPWLDANGKRQVQFEAFELKVWRDGATDPLGAGLEQLDGYLGRTGLDTGFLVLFDRRTVAAPEWETRGVWQQARTASGRAVRVLRL